MTTREQKFKDYYDKTGIQITEEPIHDEHYLAIEEDVEYLHLAIRNNPTGYTATLERLVRQYPKVSIFKNYLHIDYTFSNQLAKADRLLKETIEQHPDYIFALNSYILNIHDEHEMRTVEHYLGPNKNVLDLVKREGNVVHATEFLGFYSIVAYFWAILDEPTKAADALLPLVEAGLTEEELDDITFRLMKVRMTNMSKRLEKSSDKTHKVESKSALPTNVTTKRPTFHHPEVEIFYQYDEQNLPKEEYQKIFELPRETLIEDLEKVLQDGIQRFDDFQGKGYDDATHSFTIHALYFLGALESTSSLPHVLNLLRMDEDFLDYWYADMTEPLFFPTLFSIAQNQLAELAAYVKEENNCHYALDVVATTVSQIALYYPERRTEVIEWYRDVFDYYLANEGNKNLIDWHFLSLACSRLEQISAVELIDYVKKIGEKGWIDSFLSGSAAKIIKGIEDPPRDYDFRPVPESISEYYDRSYNDRRIKPDISILDNVTEHPAEALISKHLISVMRGDSPPSQRASFGSENSFGEYLEEPTTVKRTKVKVGRNDPCPCGSGKKYKKCCLRK